jgi:DNA-binding transcriptional LysR family regulator
MNITFRQLRVFSEVARLGHMGRAAGALHLTPPAVSMQIKELETQVGLLLFDRVGRSLSLSTAGEYFLVHARRLLADLKDTEHAMARLRKLEHGVLTIGLVSTAKYFVPHLLARFNVERSGVEVRLRVAANREELVALMQAGDADLTIMGRPPKDLDARAEPFAPHPLVFIGPAGHPLAALPAGHVSAEPNPARLLTQHRMIVREAASGTRAAMDRYLAAHRVEPRITMEMPSSETIKQAVIAGMGVGFLSLHTVGMELRSGLLQILAIEGTPVMRAWNVVHLRSKVLSPAAEAFRYFMLEQAPAYLQAHDEPLLEVLAPLAAV